MNLVKRTSIQGMQVRRIHPRRVITHLLLGGIAVALPLFTTAFIPRGKQVGFLIVTLGYLSLSLILVTLLIGPLTLLRSRRTPVNIDLRRDVGIWAAIAGCGHVLLVIRGILPSGQLLQYFLQTECCGDAPLVTLFGISNDLGLLATLLLLVLLALSNTVSLRVLKGKRWKRLQRLTYPLAGLAVAHTLGYQYLNLRGPVLLVLLISALVVVLACQGLGIALTISRQRRG